jgi:hypothetical protein
VRFTLSEGIRNLIKTGRYPIKSPDKEPKIITYFYIDGDMMVFVDESIGDSQTEIFKQHQTKVTTFSRNILKQFNRFKWTTIISVSLLGWLPGLAKSVDIYETIISYLLTSGLVVLFRKLIMNFVVNILSIRFSDKVKSLFR